MAYPPFRGGRMPFFAPQPSSTQEPLNNSQKFGFFSQTSAIQTARPINFNIKKDAIAISAPPILNTSHSGLPSAIETKFPTTTVFVGNISDLCSDELIQSILKLCGSINNWKRLQDTNSKFKAFGFCDFNHPDGTLRALRILNKFQLGDKKLTVKTDDATSKMLQDFTNIKKEHTGSFGDQINGDGDVDDTTIVESIMSIIKESNPELIKIAELVAEEEDGEYQNDCSRNSNRSSTPHESSHRKERDAFGDSKRTKTRRRSPSVSSKRRSRSNSRRIESLRSRRSRTPLDSKKKRLRRRTRDSCSNSSRSSSYSSDDSHVSLKRKHHRKSSSRHSRHRSRSNSSGGEDSDDAQERRRLRQEIKRKEQSYLKRLEKWEERERRMLKQYEKDEQCEFQRKKMLQKEAKKLKQFLEDYEDERDDQKYYKSSSLFQRRKNYEREREEDIKDKQEELLEIEELKKQILAENKNVEDADAEARKLHEAKGKEKLKCLRSHSGSPTPHRPLGQPQNGLETIKDDLTSNEDTEESIAHPTLLNESDQNGTIEEGWINNDYASTNSIDGESVIASSSIIVSSQQKANPKLIATLQKPSLSRLNDVFNDDDDDDNDHLAKKKIKPFEITREDRIQSMTPEERKKLIKDLIERIPTAKDELFAFTLSWEYVNNLLIENRLKPWINKKICDYIGDEEPSLVTFICEKIAGRTEPKKILGDLAMVLDDEAEVFMIKLWRLIIYESEAKKLGLSSLPSSSTFGAGNSTSGGDSTGRT